MENLREYEKLVTVVVRKTVFNYRLNELGLTEEDLVQEGLLALLRAKKTFKEGKGAGFKTYASICIRNRTIDIIRKAKGEPFVQHDFLQSSSDINMYDQTEKEEILNSVLDKCSKVERAIFNSYIQGYSYSEIAKIFELQKKKIDNTIQKIKQSVKREL